MVCLIYIGDSLLIWTTDERVSKCIEGLKEEKPICLVLEDDDVISGFLGILLERTENVIKLKEEGLIQRIIFGLGLEKCSPRSTSVDRKRQFKDEKGRQEV